MIETIIIDDEERGIAALKRLLENYCPEIKVVGEARNITAGAQEIRSKKPRVIFVDVEMPGGNGFELLEMFDKIDFEIIFVTAYHEYAIRALRFSALDYLLKPVKISELLQAIDRLEKKLEKNASLEATEPDRYNNLKNNLADQTGFSKIILSTLSGYHFVKLDDILYCKADESYTHFFISDGKKYTVSKPLKEYEEMFDNRSFFRIHKSFLVNLQQIEYISKDSWVVMSNKDELPVSTRKKSEFLSLMKDRR